MVGPCRGSDLRAVVATHTLGGLGHVHDGPCQQRLVSDTRLLPEFLVRPFEDRFDVCSASGDSRYAVIGHLLPELLLVRLAARRPSLPMKSASCCSPSSVVLSPRSSEANVSDARLRSALNFSSFSFDSRSRRRSPARITSLAFLKRPDAIKLSTKWL